MRQRVGLAQALIHDPEVLILDEPTIGLDPIQVLELRDLVRDLGRSHTVLFSTHILSEAEQVCDNVVIINRGHIVAEGSPSELRGTLEQGGRVLLRVNVHPDVAISAIQAIPSVAHAEISMDGIVVAPSDTKVDPRPAIARTVVEHGWDLIELRPLAVNLEEIFLELTRKAERDTAAPVEQPSESAPEGEVV
jgi:ABC-2 type transport system ATP-binding protein